MTGGHARPIPSPRGRLLLRRLEADAVGGPHSRFVAVPRRSEHQRRGRRRWRLLRHASDSQIRLQVTADRVASKHFGRTRNRGKGGPASSR